MRQDYTVGKIYWAHTDHLGSVEAVTDAFGSVIERYRYSSFGQLFVLAQDFTLLAAVPKLPFTYTGREWEQEVGMYYYRARFMDPRLGRFLSQDPLGFLSGDYNLRAYVGNNPISFIDILGLYPLDASQRSSVQWAVDQVREKGYDKIAGDLQRMLDKGNFNLDGSIPRSSLRGWKPPADIGAKPLSVIPRGLPRGGFIVDDSMSSNEYGRTDYLHPKTINLNPDHIKKCQGFVNTIVHEYVHVRQFSTIGSLLFTAGAHLTSMVKAAVDVAIGDVPMHDYMDHEYEIDMPEQQARYLANSIVQE